ncbi:hypothetical protein NDU88_004178 [Pleurodeles waltl]|uniref:Uncharacterized protein n=1 Tax=Pleurodeles waltl TaxID=8319 RepID=A0AAV7TTE8_PLEWA|nr:hypothetical protein NDU88_004178 [Pleurodeles waltl]
MEGSRKYEEAAAPGPPAAIQEAAAAPGLPAALQEAASAPGLPAVLQEAAAASGLPAALQEAAAALGPPAMLQEAEALQEADAGTRTLCPTSVMSLPQQLSMGQEVEKPGIRPCSGESVASADNSV